jgi:hypothetical protein
VSKEHLEKAPLILTPVLARELGVPEGTLVNIAAGLGIHPHRSTARARRFFSFEQAQKIAQKVRRA